MGDWKNPKNGVNKNQIKSQPLLKINMKQFCSQLNVCKFQLNFPGVGGFVGFRQGYYGVYDLVTIKTFRKDKHQ